MSNDGVFIKFNLSFFLVLITKIQNHLQQVITSGFILVSAIHHLIDNFTEFSIDAAWNETKKKCKKIAKISEGSEIFDVKFLTRLEEIYSKKASKK